MDHRYYHKAKVRVSKKKEFYKHLKSYITVNSALLLFFLINGSFSVSLYIMFFWGIGLFFHYTDVFGLSFLNKYNRDWEEREIEKEVSRLKEGEDSPWFEPEEFVPNPEFDNQIEYRDFKKLRKEWEDQDFV